MTDPTGMTPASLRGAVDLSRLADPRRGQAPAGATPGAAGGAPGAPAPEAGQPLVFETGDAGFERVLDLSATVPVIVEVIAPGLESALGDAVRAYEGRLALAVVDGSANPQLAQAFQVQQVPTIAAVVGGRPLSLMVGVPSPEELRQVLDQVLEFAAQNGVTGRLPVDAAEAPQGGPEPAPLPPLHQAAYDAIERGDYASAIESYRKALAENPRDADASAGLAQVSLLHRLQGLDAGEIRKAAADAPADVDAQLAVADLDLSGGHLDDAFGRLLDLFTGADPADRDRIRTRLLEHFELTGAEDPRVAAARRRLMTLLY
ncbi:tetratricopeptide repeat protein [Homoserinibacter sp. YIM 151385]|uniref:tetratricopeptide repeat protein n=1 Tax=Homoserinibacter sp. YIM 151385 TaxID=2985506 RepID=UPI0022F00888|nr:tetratricopeptide repeat protein [Homoserinibacter sp. YIM 151385]WBU39150.1 tetratricopeptide repeat protein [Homoserinibacter sp. YIM 151385]